MKDAWVEVDLGVLEDNIRRMQKALRRETAIIFVVKDRAYAHGLVPVVTRASESGVKWFGVVHLHEALAVRTAAESSRILLLGVAEPSDMPVLLERRIIPIVVSEDHGRALAAAASGVGKRIPVHLKIDTGMGRLGVLWEEAPAVFERLSASPGLDIQGVCTHFASVEIRKPSLGPDQLRRFQGVVQTLERTSGRRLFRHVSSSRAILYHEDWDLDGVRPGITLYGYGAGERGMRFKTRPILQWKTVVVQAKKVSAGFPIGYYSTYVTPAATTIATLAVGYADGYHRALSNKGFVLIRGRRCPVVGRVSMNWITVDAGPDSDVVTGDEAVLIGEQGKEAVWANELARLARTIPYEILTSINPAAERKYTG